MTKDQSIKCLQKINNDISKMIRTLESSNISQDVIATYLYSEYNINLYDLCKKY